MFCLRSIEKIKVREVRCWDYLIKERGGRNLEHEVYHSIVGKKLEV